MRIRRPATLAATLMLAAVPIFSSGVAAGGGSSESARQAAEHNRIVSFWTRARMQAAVPRDFAYDSVRGFHIVPRAKPGSGGGNTGASWPNGKGLVYKATGKVYFQMNGSGFATSLPRLRSASVVSFASRRAISRRWLRVTSSLFLRLRGCGERRE